MINEASQYGNVIVIINNDNWLRVKKGYVFMPQQERAEIIKNLKNVEHVYITNHKEKDADMSVCEALKIIKPEIFCNGGDRLSNNIPEVKVCEELGIKIIFNVGGNKIQSSSKLVEHAQIW